MNKKTKHRKPNFININSDSKIYAVCPANRATGGPELLHQLIYNLKKLDLNAYMYYLPNNIPDPIHDQYSKYNNPFVRRIPDKKQNIIIVPESYKYLPILKKFNNIQAVLWWLSVDNFYKSLYIDKILEKTLRGLFIKIINKINRKIKNRNRFNINNLASQKYNNYNIESNELINTANLHLVQSHYAKKHLVSKNISPNKIQFLSDYINQKFLSESVDIGVKDKRNIVIYNPKKGLEFTQELIKFTPNITFVALQNMSREKMINVIKKAKVYIDFGSHPGKDRMPRETAMLKCCIITNKKGSANYYKDVPIPDEFKFEHDKKNIPNIENKIRDCFTNYNMHIKQFKPYRDKIRQEKEKFILDLKNIFQQN